MKQKDKVTAWVYEEYKKYVMENEKIPRGEADDIIIDAVLDKIYEADIWIPAAIIRYEADGGDKLIGYYEKHEYRNKENMKMYDLW